MNAQAIQGISVFDPAQLQQDAEEQKTALTEKLSLEQVVELGEKLEKLKVEAATLQMKLDAKNKEISHIETVELPGALVDLGLKGLDLASGASIELIDIITANITDENRDAAHVWLREHGHGDLIKNIVSVTFGKGEDEFAKKLQQYLIEQRQAKELKCGSIDTKEAVHWQTLRAFVKEQLKNGEAIPAETFKLYVGNAVKIVQPKTT